MVDMRSNALGGQSYRLGPGSRPAILGLAKVLFLGLCHVSSVAAAPVKGLFGILEKEQPKDAGEPGLWVYLGIAAVLVLLGGAFAGLTIAYMGQDGIHLQVIATSSDGKEQKNAQKVLDLMKKGKHWVLVTLLLSNVIVNETLPIVLDRSLGGGWPAVAGSTVLIVIFGEVIPQAVCARYGSAIGAFMSPYVTALMWILGPIAWPTARLLDYALGEDHGSVYKKSGLKTLVTLHKTLGPDPTSRLNQDEVTIISAVLDLKEKSVGDIMTPMEDVFTMSADTVLDEATMDVILSAGYSRIPIYEPGNENNFVGMLLVKILITYDPEDCKKVREFALATLPETRPETSCLDIVNFFQEGKSHMVLVSEDPGENFGAIGVVTLEDVIEELIGEEIVDESDVYIDVHKAIRRIHPAPKARIPKGHVIESSATSAPNVAEDHLIDLAEEHGPELHRHLSLTGVERSHSPANKFGTSPKATFMRRNSSGADGKNVMVRGNMADMREHLKHLGPSNLASRPKTTRYNTVKIKSAGINGRSESRSESVPHNDGAHETHIEEPYRDDPFFPDTSAPQGGEGEGLLKSAGKDAKDGVQALQQGYGSFTERPKSSSPTMKKTARFNQEDGESRSPPSEEPLTRHSTSQSDGSGSTDTVGELTENNGKKPRKKRGAARSGSITENIIDSGGFRKVILETNSSSNEGDDASVKKVLVEGTANGSKDNLLDETQAERDQKSEEVKKKRRRNRHKKKTPKSGDEGGSGAAGSSSAV
ncbi:CBS-domain-containing protein [Glarea lozoyensis ATCC 20868]|uniref:CBS-domain-containing protein n=1 Tax=Glarea lozoyensis (strain ATCC 20868 / MF5171) TaxID=1116229 RepID=S3CZS8_GLAL2|nr:CBS-domain-containing protein [Glarea lozoyensis ATCC 20868]EPE25311.1 CBS-domain-containing protein [Glarea lozoyensis ATCC 20868]